MARAASPARGSPCGGWRHRHRQLLHRADRGVAVPGADAELRISTDWQECALLAGNIPTSRIGDRWRRARTPILDRRGPRRPEQPPDPAQRGDSVTGQLFLLWPAALRGDGLVNATCQREWWNEVGGSASPIPARLETGSSPYGGSTTPACSSVPDRRSRAPVPKTRSATRPSARRLGLLPS